MEERISKLKELIEELMSDCYADQYHICDFTEGNPGLTNQMDSLCAENELYRMIFEKIKAIPKTKTI